MNDSEPAATVVWCAGLRFAAQRDLAEDEHRSFLGWAGLLRRRGWRTLAGIPLGFAAVGAIAVALHRVAFAVPVIVSLLLLHILLGMPILISLARDSFRDSRAFRAAVQAGYVWRFEGAIDQRGVHDPAAKYLIWKQLLQAGTLRPQSLEIFPYSGLVWRVNGKQPAKWIRAGCAQVAELPTYASTAAEWVKPFVSDSDAAVYGTDREMSPAERQELKHYSRQAMWRQLPYAVLVNGVLIMTLWNPNVRKSWFVVVFVVAVALVTDRATVMSVRAGLKFHHDLGAGRIVIIRTPVTQEAAPSTILAPPYEVLPISGTLWTDNGRPAPWRTSG